MITIVRAKELLDVLDEPEELKALIKRHRPIYIFERMKVIDAINTLRTSKGSLVLVSDEFGHVQGLISPLDVFEAIAGEFRMPMSSWIWSKLMIHTGLHLVCWICTIRT